MTFLFFSTARYSSVIADISLGRPAARAGAAAGPPRAAAQPATAPDVRALMTCAPEHFTQNELNKKASSCQGPKLNTNTPPSRAS